MEQQQIATGKDHKHYVQKNIKSYQKPKKIKFEENQCLSVRNC